jgi:hypothetical protein
MASMPDSWSLESRRSSRVLWRLLDEYVEVEMK